MLKVNEIFKSIQGESSYVGLPCTFVRLTGCQLRCTWCDTTYAFYEGKDMSMEEVIHEVGQHGLKLFELTGGEPLLQPDAFTLVKDLSDQRTTVLVETSGAVRLETLDPRAIKIMDIKCPSSQMSDKMLWENIECLTLKDEVKFVLADRKDFDWACDIIQKYDLPQKARLLFSPVFDHLKPSELATWILDRNLPVRMQLQIHKYIWGREARGV